MRETASILRGCWNDRRATRLFRTSAIVVAIMAIAAMSAPAEEPRPALPPLSQPVLRTLLKDPEAWHRFREQYAAIPRSAPNRPMPPKAGLAWTPLKNPLPGIPSTGLYGASNPLLLTDGTVIVHISCTPNWYRLTPTNGNYVKGVWSAIAPMPNGYAPRFFASAVLRDGRVIVEGGEYSGPACARTDTTLGAIYDPRSDRWTPVDPPSGWAKIGDASSTPLADGTYFLSTDQNDKTALFDAAKLTWTATGTGKFDGNDEENWTLLPSGNILTVDAYTDKSPCGMNSEEYVPGTGKWIGTGSTIVELSGCSGLIRTLEAPTQILRPNGTVVAFGATASRPSQNFPVHTSIYSVAKSKWAAGPDMPKVGSVNYTMADAPAAILPNGNVLIAASPATWLNTTTGGYPTPTHFFVFNGATFTQVGDVANSPNLNSFEMNFLVLPTGEILGVETDYPNVEVFPATGSTLVCCSAKSWAPTIAKFPSSITDGTTYTISGTQFNGLTYGASFGDDEQANTNYPLIRVTNTATKTVSYCATFNFSTMGVATGGTAVSTDFSCAAPAGPSTLVVVANGIASAPVNVAIKTDPTTLFGKFCQDNISCGYDEARLNGLVMDSSRNLFGTTGLDGNLGGTLFEVPFDSSTQKYASAIRILYTFCSQGGTNCTDGARPTGLMMDAFGNLFGTTQLGGSFGVGTLFELPLNAATKTYAGAVKTLYNFCAAAGNTCPDGSFPGVPPIMDRSGNLFGTTVDGGTCCDSNTGEGTIFELPFNRTTKTYASAVKTLYNFCQDLIAGKCSDGEGPNVLTIDRKGNLFGTTLYGGSVSSGTIFELHFTSSTNTYASNITILHNFCSQGDKCPDGGGPTGGVIMDATGNLFGTTGGGGSHHGGVVFELPIESNGAYASATKILYDFCSQGGTKCTDGANLSTGIVMDPTGNLFGTTANGGTGNVSGGAGTVFELPFNAADNKYVGPVQVLHNFCSQGGSKCTDGAFPNATLMIDGLSKTLFGGTDGVDTRGANYGTVFAITP
jgi:hypothetical protein